MEATSEIIGKINKKANKQTKNKYKKQGQEKEIEKPNQSRLCDECCFIDLDIIRKANDN